MAGIRTWESQTDEAVPGAGLQGDEIVGGERPLSERDDMDLGTKDVLYCVGLHLDGSNWEETN